MDTEEGGGLGHPSHFSVAPQRHQQEDQPRPPAPPLDIHHAPPHPTPREKKYKHVWEIDRDAYIRRYERAQKPLSSFELDIQRYIQLQVRGRGGRGEGWWAWFLHWVGTRGTAVIALACGWPAGVADVCQPGAWMMVNEALHFRLAILCIADVCMGMP